MLMKLAENDTAVGEKYSVGLRFELIETNKNSEGICIRPVGQEWTKFRGVHLN